jgi:hypothetical protein
MRTAVLLVLLSLTATTAHSAVLCARPRRDGTFNSTVKVREACRPHEVQLDPGEVNFCCSTTTTSTTPTTIVTPTTAVTPSSSTSTALAVSTTTASNPPVSLSTTSTVSCFTVTTGSLPQYQPCSPTNCVGRCATGMSCGDIGGGCGCIGTPPPCGDINTFDQPSLCSYGVCPAGQTCVATPSPPCGCTCQ